MRDHVSGDGHGAAAELKHPIRFLALVALDLIERHATVGRMLAGEPEHAFTDDVARDLGGAPAERRRLPGQVALAVPQQVVADIDDAAAACERQYCVELQMMDLGVHHANY